MKNEVKLLVIDDDEINIFIIKKIVEKTGYDVSMVSKTNGQVAIDYLQELIDNNLSFPNLILVDINMPILNGWEFLDSYDKLGIQKNIDMYMLSSSVYENDMEKAKTYKTVKGFISKLDIPLHSTPRFRYKVYHPFRSKSHQYSAGKVTNYSGAKYTT